MAGRKQLLQTSVLCRKSPNKTETPCFFFFFFFFFFFMCSLCPEAIFIALLQINPVYFLLKTVHIFAYHINKFTRTGFQK